MQWNDIVINGFEIGDLWEEMRWYTGFFVAFGSYMFYTKVKGSECLHFDFEED